MRIEEFFFLVLIINHRLSMHRILIVSTADIIPETYLQVKGELENR
jgi:hypothetical protein